jgi:hypothetical protein
MSDSSAHPSDRTAVSAVSSKDRKNIAMCV